MKRAFWINEAEVRHEGTIYSVAYKHHIDPIPTNPGEITHFYQYQARDDKEDRDGTAWEWGETFKMLVTRTGKLIEAKPEFGAGLIFNAACVDCRGGSFLIEVNRTSHDLIKIEVDPERPMRGWVPKGYADATHIRNDIRIRTR